MRCCRRLREQTRTDHLRQVAAYLGWRSCGPMELKALDDFLLLRAMEHDAPGVLFHLACEHLRSERIIRPGVITLVEWVGAAREAAWTETHQRLAAAGLLTADRCEDLDDLLEVTPSLGRTRLAWLGEGATQATPKAIKAELDKLTFLCGLDADTFDVGMLAPERRRWLAGIGRRSTNQALQRRPSVRRYSVLLAQACNLGLAGMAEASGISYDALAWTTEWYLREETLDVANTAIVNHHHHPLAAAWGGGTLSSSDGQRFPVRGRSLTARRLSRYFVDEGISAYTHVSDQHATYGTKVIVATDREATYVLDAILGNQTDLQIAEHVTDTHGQTLLNFALFDLLGKQLSPRIRDLGAITLYRLNTRGEVRGRFPNAGHLLTGKLNAALIREHWDDLLRLAASLKFGYATASLLVAKLQAGSRQNALAAALQEYGKLIRTVHAVRYLVDETYQRKITRQLNKGETLHALRRDLLFAHDGALRRRHHDQQTEQALCHTLVTNAIVAWNTVYIGLALDALGAGAGIDQELVGHLSPALLEHIRVYGTYTFDVDAEWRRAGYRPLREPAERQHGGT